MALGHRPLGSAPLASLSIYVTVPVVAPTHPTGGDDAYHGVKHPGWNKKQWKKKNQEKLALSELVRKLYYDRKNPKNSRAVRVEVIDKIEPQVNKIYVLPADDPIDASLSRFNISNATYRHAINQAGEDDDEEALFLLFH